MPFTLQSEEIDGPQKEQSGDGTLDLRMRRVQEAVRRAALAWPHGLGVAKEAVPT